ncbi:hypothetical protein SAMN04487935_3812 [Flavobacterium noncentrifugens]|uniref:Uncharacterized protein n=1 Tax=Flavobacterium noncentrifugens TaxID=1128970 RepID=A0A1G9DGA9_9FLAO|nr:hypothetical protein SAMN04487935_3812 [Flavobacterium noncentrifugens]
MGSFINYTSHNSRFTQLRGFRSPEIFISRTMFYLGRENSTRFHSQLREAAKRYVRLKKNRHLNQTFHENITFIF